MTKHPTAGKVKTRLTPALTPEQAAGVHATFLKHLTARLARLNAAELVICFDPPDKVDAMRALLDGSPIAFLPQCPGDLGARIGDAAARLFPRHDRLLFMGIDSPDLPLAHLFKAAELTEQAPVSLSPTPDGGYWSLGLAKSVDAAALLRDIPWSSGQEAVATLRAAEALGHTSVTGLAWDDVDHPPDLRRLLTRLSRSDVPADAELLSNLRHVLPAQWFFG
jgi:rSAM/selenodomain-associated transferase 1